MVLFAISPNQHIFDCCLQVFFVVRIMNLELEDICRIVFIAGFQAYIISTKSTLAIRKYIVFILEFHD